MRERFANWVLSCLRLTQSWRDAHDRGKEARRRLMEAEMRILGLQNTLKSLLAREALAVTQTRLHSENVDGALMALCGRIDILEAQPPRKGGKRG